MSEQLTKEGRPGGWPIRAGLLLLILGGLLSLDLAGSSSLAASSADAMNDAAAIATACVPNATGSASIECLGTGSEETDDPVEDGREQATTESLELLPLAPGAAVWFGSCCDVRLPRTFVEPAAARAPPST